LGLLFDAMAGGDPFLRDVARRVVFASLGACETILYRQAALRDCLQNRTIVRGIYDLTTEFIDRRRKIYWGFISRSSRSILYNAVNLLEMSRRVPEKAEAHR
jgi:hypothetical protein